jgi:hypothetical protein
MKTEIFSTSRARRDANLCAFHEQERHYRPALIAMDRAFEKAGADDPEVVVNRSWTLRLAMPIGNELGVDGGVTLKYI